MPRPSSPLQNRRDWLAKAPRTATAAIASLVLAFHLPACSTTCDARAENSAAQQFAGGRTSPDGSFYETNAFDEPFLLYEPGRRLELLHRLREAPRHIAVFVAFEPDPLVSGAGFAPAAGNQAEIERVDDTAVLIRNDTCSELYVRLEASIPTASDAGADGG